MRRVAAAIGMALLLLPASASARTAAPTSVDSVAWSPGTSIVYSSGEIGGPRGVFVVSPSGGRPRRVAPAGLTPRWSPSGRLAYTADSNLYVVNGDGSGRRLLRKNAFLMDWSPAGDRILYITLQGDLGWIRPDGTFDERLTTVVPEAADAVWSPDGRSVAFLDCRVPGSSACEHADAWDVYTLKLGGPNRRKRVTRSPIAEGCLTWAPGPKIAFQGKRGVYVGNRLVIPNAECPSWSPNGRLLAAFGQRAVIVTNGNGSSRRRAAAFAKRISQIFAAAAWSPDGRRIAFAWPVGPKPVYRLFTARALGGLRRIT